MESRNKKVCRWAKSAALFSVMYGLAVAAEAVEIKSDNPDIKMRWDNTVRYNVGVRANSIDKIGNNPAFDEGEYKFGRGSVVTNRVDLLSEFDFIYKKDMGFRVSSAGWYDHAYREASARRNPQLPSDIAGSYIDDKYSNYTKRYAAGPSGEFLDAFVFGKFNIGEMPLTFKAGQHTLYWGETLLLGGGINGIAYSQMPLDLAKGFATPGVDAKELFLPLNNISVQLLATNELSIAAQYFLDWKPTRIPEGGTYLGPADFLMYGAERVAPGLVNAGVSKPKHRGDWGINARWNSEAIGGTAGFYYRKFTDKLPSILMTEGQYREYFGEDIDLFGLSLSKQIGDVSVGMELSYRKNMPLNSQTLGMIAAPAPLASVLFPNGAPSLIGNTYQARGNTAHAVVSALGIVPANSFWDSATWIAEMTYVYLDKITENQDMYYGQGHGVCNAGRRSVLGALYNDKWDGCSTKSSFGIGINFTPAWLQVLPGVDLTMPIAFSQTLKGNAPVAMGGNQGNGSYSAGFGLDVDAKYRIELKYVDYFGHVKEGPGVVPGTTQVTSANGLSTVLKDRGWVALTLKTTF
jgi:hypothetical protein